MQAVRMLSFTSSESLYSLALYVRTYAAHSVPCVTCQRKYVYRKDPSRVCIRRRGWQGSGVKWSVSTATLAIAIVLIHDQLTPVRQKAKDITNLLMDDARMREQRRSRSDMRDRMSGGRQRDDSPDSSDEERRRAAYRKAPKDTSAFNRSGPEDDDLARAIEESKRSARQDQTKYQQKSQQDTDLEEAMRLSKEEEDRRKRMLDGNNSSLFDPDAPENQNRQTPNFGWDSLVDTGNDQQQPQMQMPMITGFAQFNPYAQQQQEEYMRQQQQMLEMQRQVGRLSSFLSVTADLKCQLKDGNASADGCTSASRTRCLCSDDGSTSIHATAATTCSDASSNGSTTAAAALSSAANKYRLQ